MSDNFTAFIAAGLDGMYMTRLDANGHPTGWTADPANGDQDGNGGMRRVEVAVAIPQFTTEPPVTDIEGDNKVKGKFPWDPDVPEFVLTARGFDLETAAGLQGTEVYNLGDMATGIWQPRDPDRATVMVMSHSNAKERTPGAEGTTGWISYVLMSADAIPMGPDSIQYRQEHTDQYKITANEATHFLGKTIGDHWGTQGGVILAVTSEYRIMIASYRGDAAETDFNLPDNYDLVEASGDKIVVLVNGVLQTYTADYTANAVTNVLTMVAPPAAGAYIDVLYQWS